MNTGPREAAAVGAGGVRELLLATILDWPSPRGEQVSYRSKGSCLVFGPGERIRAALSRWPAGIRWIAFSDDTEIRPEAPADRERCHVGEIVSLHGHLGTFRARVATGETTRDIAPLSPNGNGLFDLVLDLRDNPLLHQEVPPPGYWHCADDGAPLERTLARLARRVGLLAKPRYYDYDSQRCSHDRQGVKGCQRCLSACPAEAITSGEGAIAIDPHLCQGCGGCTQVCPNGAISFAWPDRTVMLQRIDQLIQGYVRLGERAPSILFYRDRIREPARLLELCASLPDEVLPIPVHAVGSIGVEVWLATLALGASAVFIEDAPHASALARAQLNDALDMARSVLTAIDIEPTRIRHAALSEIEGHALHDATPVRADAPSTWPADKRGVLLQAIRALSKPTDEAIVLHGLARQGLGDLAAREDRCTLCGACARLCPVSALHIQATHRLYFDATRCTQCGLCIDACPEDALTAHDRFPLDDACRPIHESDQLAHCARCGEAFSTQRLVDKSIALLETLPSFEAGRADLLRMCPACRQLEAFGQG
ncbi:MAG TPA: 4Fe-4S dicluster domain-containing protein [Chromatiaceae bacterium]|nr:4Fe-4S dicluster domain-containing protein [Chromatiaceae bacterium]